MSTDWLPGRRADKIVMIRNWITIMSPAEVRTAWGIPAAQFTELGNLFATAQALLQKAESGDRTPVITEECRVAFEALDDEARFFKNHYFLIPPLTTADIVNLGLSLRNDPSSIPKPEAQVEADLTFPGIHLVELANIRAVGTFGLPDPRSDYGTRIFYGLFGPPSDEFRFRLTEPPKSGKDLPYSVFTRRKKERFDFDGESGNRVYFCIRYENAKGGPEGEGPFGPILSAVIP
jgi:hypothetical protein